MRKIFKKSDICSELIEHINCDDEMIENTIINFLSEQFPSNSKFNINYIDDDTIEVEINN